MKTSTPLWKGCSAKYDSGASAVTPGVVVSVTESPSASSLEHAANRSTARIRAAGSMTGERISTETSMPPAPPGQEPLGVRSALVFELDLHARKLDPRLTVDTPHLGVRPYRCAVVKGAGLHRGHSGEQHLRDDR